MTRSPRQQLAAFLGQLADDHRSGEMLEIRYVSSRGAMHRRFVPTRRVDDAARTIRALAPRTDVYCGVLPRVRRAGGRGAVIHSHLVFIEIDQPDALARLDRFGRRPTMIVTSGSPGHAHAYWRLRTPVDPDGLERANRILAYHLGGDLASVDAARILRPPASWNHKHAPPARVELLELDPERRYEIDELLTGLAEPSEQRNARAAGPRRTARNDLDRRLLAIPAPDYVQALAGLSPDRHGKIPCPFHEDRTASLQLYGDGTWYCFGACHAGGSVFDFAGRWFGLETKGRSFLELRARLAVELGVGGSGRSTARQP